MEGVAMLNPDILYKYRKCDYKKKWDLYKIIKKEIVKKKFFLFLSLFFLFFSIGGHAILVVYLYFFFSGLDESENEKTNFRFRVVHPFNVLFSNELAPFYLHFHKKKIFFFIFFLKKQNMAQQFFYKKK
jgi:Na+/melibiose symporter-like transporter